MLERIENEELVNRISVLRSYRIRNKLSYRDLACLGHTTIVRIAQMEQGVCESSREMHDIVSKIERSVLVGV